MSENVSLRIRQIKPAFWIDRPMRMLDPAYQMLYIGLWQVADDAGYFPWRPDEIADVLHLADWIVTDGVTAIDQLPGEKRVVIDECDRHAHLTRLVAHQWFAGPTRRVYRHEREHRRECVGDDVPGPGTHAHSASSSPTEPGGARESPRREGKRVGEGVGKRVGEGVGGPADEQSSSTTLSQDRPDVAYLRALGWLRVTSEQLRILDEIADRERPSDVRSGQQWNADAMLHRPPGEDPLAWLMAEDTRERNRRMTAAREREALAAAERPSEAEAVEAMARIMAHISKETR